MYDGELSTPNFREFFRQEKNNGHPVAGACDRPNGLRVLVVDDDFAIKVLVAAMLEVLDCQVDRAENGAEALALMAKNRYDLVLTDLYMPVMDGFQLAGAIRTQWPQTKIVIMTGAGQDDVQSDANSRQADAWIFKPFGLKEIRRVMDRFEWP